MQFKKAVSNETALKSSMHTTGSYVQHAPKVRRLLLKSGKSCRFRQGSVPLVRGRPQAIAFALGCTARKLFWFVTMFIIGAAPDAVKLLEYALSCYGVTHLSEGHIPNSAKNPPACTQFSCKPGAFLNFSPWRGRRELSGQGSSHMPRAYSDWQE